MLSAIADYNLARAISQLVVLRQFFRDRLAQLRNSRAGCILGEPRLQCFDSRRLDVLWRVKTRLTRTESADIDPFGFHRFRLAVDGKRHRGSKLSGAFGYFHVVSILS